MGAIDEYKKILKQIEEKDAEIAELELDPAVQKYKKAITRKNALIVKRGMQLPFAKMEEYSECSHKLVFAHGLKGKTRKRIQYNKACVVCGLNFVILDYDKKDLNKDQKTMYDHFQSISKKHLQEVEKSDNTIYSGKCDIDLATIVYSRISAQFPHLSDEQLNEKFSKTMDKLKEECADDKAKKAVAKTYGLKPSQIRF